MCVCVATLFCRLGGAATEEAEEDEDGVVLEAADDDETSLSVCELATRNTRLSTSSSVEESWSSETAELQEKGRALAAV